MIRFATPTCHLSTSLQPWRITASSTWGILIFGSETQADVDECFALKCFIETMAESIDLWQGIPGDATHIYEAAFAHHRQVRHR
jgi:hypothetical protein